MRGSMRLSKRAWNNVLIFACLGMIIIFNLMSGKLIDNAEGSIATILPEQSMILTLEYPNVSIERLGTSWRVNPSEFIQPADVERIMNTWLTMSGEISLATSDEEGYRVTLWLAGQEHPMKLWVQPESQLITDILNQKTWMISPSQLNQLTVKTSK